MGVSRYDREIPNLCIWLAKIDIQHMLHSPNDLKVTDKMV